jgi:hypothetical protein
MHSPRRAAEARSRPVDPILNPLADGGKGVVVIVDHEAK